MPVLACRIWLMDLTGAIGLGGQCSPKGMPYSQLLFKMVFCPCVIHAGNIYVV